jgi:hypothetical protein
MSIEGGYWFCLIHRNVERDAGDCATGFLDILADLPSGCEMVPCEVHYS